MKQQKLPYEVASVEVTLLSASDLIATSGKLTHVDGDEGSWV